MNDNEIAGGLKMDIHNRFFCRNNDLLASAESDSGDCSFERKKDQSGGFWRDSLKYARGSSAQRQKNNAWCNQ